MNNQEAIKNYLDQKELVDWMKKSGFRGLMIYEHEKAKLKRFKEQAYGS